ncbi:hypothetical protein N431DRAFT_445552 [Stipitochalara longipes BDJ]|nr:hypothetical protein N431DRAFT_445552 [Stipitochalara longipes BDJ]
MPRPLPASQPTTFHNFAQLPFDIRLLIWGLLIPTHVIHVSYERDPGYYEYNVALKRWQRWGRWTILSPRSRLLNLSICKESREECKKTYFEIRLASDSTWSVYFNPRKDILFLDVNILPWWPPVMPPRLIDLSFSHKLVNLAISHDLWFGWDWFSREADCQRCDWRNGDRSEFFGWLRNSMCSLKTIKLVKHAFLLSRYIRSELYFVKLHVAGTFEQPGKVAEVQNFFGDGVEVQCVRGKEDY